MKFAICNEIFKDWEWAKVAGCASSLGYDGIEVAPFTFAESVSQVTADKRREIKNTAARNKLEIAGLHWLLVSPKGLSLSSPDQSVRDTSIKYLKELIDFCGDIGGKIMVFGSPKARDIQRSSTYNDAYGYVRECFAKVLPRLKDRDVTLCLEPLTLRETNFINTAQEAIRMIKDISHPNFRLNLDVKAMSAEQKPIPEVIEESGEFLAHFHANDPNLLGPGFGKVDYVPVREALYKVFYNGYISVEVFDFSPGPEAIAKQSIEYLKKIF